MNNHSSTELVGLVRLVLAAALCALLPAAGARVSASQDIAVAPVAPPFLDYYRDHQGERVLGFPLSGQVEFGNYPAQYFEKGRIEDHGGEIADPAWAFMYGRLTIEMIERNPDAPIDGLDCTYRFLANATRPEDQHSPPVGFTGDTEPVEGGEFVPFDAHLGIAPGYIVPAYFWRYINREELFPAGWLHDIGLPVADAFQARALKDGASRQVTVQAFERAVLTYDPQNPAGWEVEKGNIGVDAWNLGGAGGPPTGLDTLELPLADARVTLPVHIAAHTGKPGEQVTAELRWQDGTRLTNTFTLLADNGALGILVGNLDWINALQPPQPKTQPATLELRNASGEMLLQRRVAVVSGSDRLTQEIKLYWTVSGTELTQPQVRRVVQARDMASVALEELLWGPPTISQVGYGTAIPTPRDVLAFPGRAADWGPRVTLRGLTIEDGVATADFSQEMLAYDGGSLRVKLIRDQITYTLKQFPEIRTVRIAVDGRTEGVLEP